MDNTIMIGIESATCAHISINSQQFAPPLPTITTQTSTISTNDWLGQTEHCSHTTVYNTCVPHYSMAGDKPTPLPLFLQDTLHGNSHMLRLAHDHSTGFQLHPKELDSCAIDTVSLDRHPIDQLIGWLVPTKQWIFNNHFLLSCDLNY